MSMKVGADDYRNHDSSKFEDEEKQEKTWRCTHTVNKKKGEGGEEIAVTIIIRRE